MNALSELAALLVDEEALVKKAEPASEISIITRILYLLKKRKDFESDLITCQIEISTISLYKHILGMPKYKYYTDQINKLLQKDISEGVMLILEHLLGNMKDEFMHKINSSLQIKIIG